MAYALKNFLNVLHKAVMKDRFGKFNVSEVALTLSCLATGFTLLIHGADTESKIIGT